VEDFIRGTELKEFYRSFSSGSAVYVAQRRVNGNGRFLELGEYGIGGRRSFIVILEGREGRGWAGCAVQLRKVVNFLQPSGNVGSKNEKINGGVPPMTQLVEEGRWLYVEALVGKRHERK
jgi:hypothetical protein